MAKLHSLIKFQRHNLDEKRRLLAVLNSELEQLQAYRQQMLNDLAQEKDLAAVDIDCARNFPLYMKRIMSQVADFDEMIAAKNLEIQAATFVVQEAFMEVKKLELTQENRDKVETDRLARLENIDLDEMGINSFLRGQEDEKK